MAKEKVILAILVDPDEAYRDSEFFRARRDNDNAPVTEIIEGDVAVLMEIDGITDSNNVKDVSDVAQLAAEAANALRDARAIPWDDPLYHDVARDAMQKAELNLEKILDRVSVISYGEGRAE